MLTTLNNRVRVVTNPIRNTEGLSPVTQYQREAAIKWFVNRFVHRPADVLHALRRGGVEPLPEAKEWSRQKFRHPDLDFDYIEAGNKLVIVPKRPEAAWAEGLIWIDSNQEYQYTTGKPVLNATLPNIEKG